MNRQPIKIKIIIEEGIAAGVLADGDVEVEIIDIDPDYGDYEALRRYEAEIRADPALKEREFTVAAFADGRYDPWPHEGTEKRTDD